MTTYVARYLEAGDAGLADRSSATQNSNTRSLAVVVELSEAKRRERTWSARRIHRHLTSLGHPLHLSIVGRWLARLRISRLWDLTSDGTI